MKAPSNKSKKARKTIRVSEIVFLVFVIIANFSFAGKSCSSSEPSPSPLQKRVAGAFFIKDKEFSRGDAAQRINLRIVKAKTNVANKLFQRNDDSKGECPDVSFAPPRDLIISSLKSRKIQIP